MAPKDCPAVLEGGLDQINLVLIRDLVRDLILDQRGQLHPLGQQVTRSHQQGQVAPMIQQVQRVQRVGQQVGQQVGQGRLLHPRQVDLRRFLQGRVELEGLP